MFKSVDFPAPDVPMMPVNSPDLNSPLIDLSIWTLSLEKMFGLMWYDMERNWMFILLDMIRIFQGYWSIWNQKEIIIYLRILKNVRKVLRKLWCMIVAS